MSSSESSSDRKREQSVSAKYSESSAYLNTDTEFGTKQTGGGILETEALEGELKAILRVLEKSEAYPKTSEESSSIASSFFETSDPSSSLKSQHLPSRASLSSSSRRKKYRVSRLKGGNLSTSASNRSETLSQDSLSSSARESSASKISSDQSTAEQTVRIIRIKKPRSLSPLPEISSSEEVTTSVASTASDTSVASTTSSAS